MGIWFLLSSPIDPPAVSGTNNLITDTSDALLDDSGNNLVYVD